MERVFNNPNFYPTPLEVIEKMTEGIVIKDKIFLEPSAGKGNIVDFLLMNGAKNVLSCENNEDLKKILQTKCKILESDFLTLTSDKISHIDCIVMNPPFGSADLHILHAFNIAPSGCKIVALCNSNTLTERYSETRRKLFQVISENGNFIDLGNCFNESERSTNVNVSLITINKAGASYQTEFEGFFMEDEEEQETGAGLMPYNVVRDLVNRYVGAVKIFDEQIEAAIRMNALTGGFYSAGIGLNISKDKAPITRNEFKKEMQKSGWNFVFSKMNMQKYATRGLKEDINKFVEQQQNIPFTMKNIYKMLEIVIGTQSQRMDKALIEVFDKLTQHYHDNRYNVEGWKTNSAYLLNERFIMPRLIKGGYYGEIDTEWSSNFELIEDMVKAVCYITGQNYDDMISLYNFIHSGSFLMDGEKIVKSWRRNETPIHDHLKYPNCVVKSHKLEWGKWVEWGFFKIRCYKKGTVHFEFKDQDLWAKFNQHIARIKGYPLPEKCKTKKETVKPTTKKETVAPIILGTFKVKQVYQQTAINF